MGVPVAAFLLAGLAVGIFCLGRRGRGKTADSPDRSTAVWQGDVGDNKERYNAAELAAGAGTGTGTAYKDNIQFGSAAAVGEKGVPAELGQGQERSQGMNGRSELDGGWTPSLGVSATPPPQYHNTGSPDRR